MGLERSKTVCFTGVKQEKLLNSGSRVSQRIRALKRILSNEIADSINEGYEFFMTGMQPGTELWAGEAVLELKNRYPVKLVAVLPYKGFSPDYTVGELWAFSRIISEADAVVTVCKSNVKGFRRMKDMFMVQQSARIIGMAGDVHERTDAFRTLKYAAEEGLDIICMDPAAIFYEAEKHLDKNDPSHVLFNDYDPDKMRRGRGVVRCAGRNFTVIGNAPAEYDVMEISEKTDNKVPKVTGSKALHKISREDTGKSAVNIPDRDRQNTAPVTVKGAVKQPENKSKKPEAERKNLNLILRKQAAVADPNGVKLEDIIDSRYSVVMDDTLKLE